MPDSAGRIAARILRRSGLAALATAEPDGQPFVSLVAVAVDPDGAPLMLLSGLARHTRNLGADPRASLLLSEPDKGDDPLAAARLTLIGRIGRIGPEAAEGARRHYLARHPGAAAYAGFGDFAIHRMTVATAHLVAGFGRIETVDRATLAAAFTAETGA